MLDVESLYRKYGPMVLRRCRALLKDEEKALDAMQETFVRLLRRKASLNDAAPSSLLYCIATNICFNELRSAKTRKTSPVDQEILDLIASREDVQALGDAKILLEAIFEDEDESTRVMAVLHYVDGLTFEETALRTGLSVSGVRKRLGGLQSRARLFVEEGNDGKQAQ